MGLGLRWFFVVALSCSAFSSVQGQASPESVAPSDAVDRTEEAKGLYSAGKASFDAGRYADALNHFQQSYAISGRAGLLYNIAITLDRLREDKKALEAYEKYLALAPDAANRSEVEIRAAAIREALARQQTSEGAVLAPTPLETAQASPLDSAAESAPVSQPTERTDRDGGLLSRWWFWTAVGVVVAGGVTATLIAVSSGEESPDPIEPGTGVVVTTLRSWP